MHINHILVFQESMTYKCVLLQNMEAETNVDSPYFVAIFKMACMDLW